MSLERIFEALVRLGLSEADVRVYIFLALKGPKRARNIVDNLKINKQQIYRSLKRLQKSNIIIANTEHPAEFSASPFEKVLESLMETKQKQAKDIQKRRKELLSSWRANEK